MERLSGLDATFLYLETPTHHMHVAMTMVLDPATMPGGYSFDKLKAFIRSRLHVVPLFHRRLAEVPFRLNHPVWVEDPDFDLDYHVRRIGAPSPGGRRELAEIAGQIASTPLDRTKPLWEMWVVEGLKQDRVGVITKVHHAAIDGASGADFLVHLFDLEPMGSESFNTPVELPVEHLPNDLELLSFAAASLGRRTANMVPLLGRTVRSVARVIQGRRSPEKLVGAIPLSAPSTPWTASVTGHRSTAFARVPLSELKRIKNTFGCTLNDVVLALVSGTLREYLEEKGALPSESLLAICPISVRNDESGDERTVGKPRVGDVRLPRKRRRRDPRPHRAHPQLHQGGEGGAQRGRRDDAHGLGRVRQPERLQHGVAALLQHGTGDRHRAIHNVIISNVPGPNFPLYFAGAELVAAYPLGPVMEGCGLNITVFSYRDSVDVGFMACRELIPDVWDLADATNRAMRDLSDAADREAARAERMVPASTVDDDRFGRDADRPRGGSRPPSGPLQRSLPPLRRQPRRRPQRRRRPRRRPVHRSRARMGPGPRSPPARRAVPGTRAS